MNRLNRLAPLLLIPSLSACSHEPEASPAPPGAPAVTQGPIVNGQVETGYPAVGALTARYGTQYAGSFCTGTLIAPRWVLTAAHCVTDVSADQTRFFIGNDARPTSSGAAPTTGSFHQASRLIPHENYNNQRLENDIALVELREAVTAVEPLPYHTGGLSTLVGQDLFYVGFGVTDGINERGGGLKRSASMVLDSVYTKTFLSAYNGQGTCFGDSGGPAFLTINGTRKIVGLTSAGAPCQGFNCDPCQSDSINVRADAYASWIQEKMGAAPPNCNDDASLCNCAGACQADGRCDDAVCQVGSCRDTYECLFDCPEEDADCQQACVDAATPEGFAALEAMFGCFENRCANTSGSAFQTCADANCRAEISACFPPEPTPTGEEDCLGVYECMTGCPETNAEACLDGCFYSGTETAQTQLTDMFDCFSTRCDNLSGDAFQQCANSQCGSEIQQCLGGSEPCDLLGGDCPGGEACWPTTSGSTACFPTAGIAVGAACNPGSEDLECRDGDVCVGASETEGTCAPFCRTNADCADGAFCNLNATGLRGVGLCELPGSSCVDADEDGVCRDEDCNDQAAGVNPDAPELCGDGVDNDCSGEADDGCPGDDTDPGTGGGDPGPGGGDPGPGGGTGGTVVNGSSTGCSGGGAGQPLALLVSLALAGLAARLGRRRLV